jgi:hypothetical protein
MTMLIASCVTRGSAVVVDTACDWVNNLPDRIKFRLTVDRQTRKESWRITMWLAVVSVEQKKNNQVKRLALWQDTILRLCQV